MKTCRGQEAPLQEVVYVVDDDDLARDVICANISEAGYRVEGYGDPAEFLSAAASLCSGCIVLDLDMPGIDGLQLQASLAELGCRLPVIFYSGKAGVRDAVGGMQAGAVDFLRKSPDVGPLLRAIRKLIGSPVAARSE